MPDPQDAFPLVTPLASATGVPLIPPAVVAWIALSYWVTAPILVALVQFYPASHGVLVALLVVQSIASGLGIASPGLRRAP